MKAAELRDKTPDQLREDLEKLKMEGFNLRFQAATGQLENTARKRAVRRGAARVKTILNEKARPLRPSEVGKMPKRILTGVVVGDQNEQTITVQVERRYAHPVMKKTVRSAKKYRAHDELNAYKKGDQVRIQECPPRSKSKRWEVVSKAE